VFALFSLNDPTRAKAAAHVGSKMPHNKTMVTIVGNTTNGRTNSIIALLLTTFHKIKLDVIFSLTLVGETSY
jgi:hypothetical protein